MSGKNIQIVKRAAPMISSTGAQQVSQHRRASLNEEVAQGKFRDGSGGGTVETGLTAASHVTFSGKIKKFASSSTGANWRGPSGDTVRQGPQAYSPLWLNSNLNLPRDKNTINAWCRAFYALNPLVHNAINLHSTYPISKLNIRCPDKRVEQFFNEMIEETDLMNVCVQLAQEFWLLGEAIVYAELDDRNLRWGRILIQNPDYIDIRPSVMASEPLIMLKPDPNLKRIVNSTKPSDLEQKRQLGPHIIEYVKRGQNIPLDNFYVSHLARKIHPYDVRGTGLPVNVFRQLMLFDKLREAKYVQADSMINPLTLVKIGSADYKPQPADLDAWRQVFEEAQNDADFKIFTHEAVTVEKIGSGSGIYDTSGDITQLLKEIYIGLMVPQVLMDGGGDTTYANGGVALDVLRQRYMQFRNMIAAWLRRKIFAPISKLNDFFEYKEKTKKLIVPEIDWNHMSLFDAGDYIQKLSEMTQDPANKRVSVQTLYRSLGLEYEEEVRKIRREDIQAAIREKEQESLKKMPLNELRTISEEDEINEILPTPLPGEDASDVAAGSAVPTMPGAGGTGIDLSSAPPPTPPK